jgi:hypothetical protein
VLYCSIVVALLTLLNQGNLIHVTVLCRSGPCFQRMLATKYYYAWQTSSWLVPCYGIMPLFRCRLCRRRFRNTYCQSPEELTTPWSFPVCRTVLPFGHSTTGSSKWKTQTLDGPTVSVQKVKGFKAVPWLNRLVFSLWKRKLGFASGSAHTGIAMDRVALGPVFLRILPFSPVSIMPPVLHTHIVWRLNDRPTGSRVQRHSLIPSTWTRSFNIREIYGPMGSMGWRGRE